MQTILADVTCRRGIRKVCRTAQPDVVYHAAAYKHVGMLERSVCAAVETNALGTYYAARAARDSGASFVLISTDKASHPRSVMGASKRLAELLVLSLADQSFRPRVVRFGNVLGSSGSVLELMRNRIERRQPIQVTHPEASRFFMTADEAASLVMLVDLFATAPGVYWLDMGKPIEILQLARRLLATARDRGIPAVPIEFTGLRPGEKLSEEFPVSDVVPFAALPSSIYRLRGDLSPARSWPVLIGELQRCLARADARAALAAVIAAVPDYRPSISALESAGGGRLRSAA